MRRFARVWNPRAEPGADRRGTPTLLQIDAPGALTRTSRATVSRLGLRFLAWCRLRLSAGGGELHRDVPDFQVAAFPCVGGARRRVSAWLRGMLCWVTGLVWSRRWRRQVHLVGR